jgi:hypothetical protein
MIIAENVVSEQEGFPYTVAENEHLYGIRVQKAKRAYTAPYGGFAKVFARPDS